MDIFYNDIVIIQGKIIVGKIPETADSQLHQVISNLLGGIFGNTEHSDLRVPLSAEIRKGIGMRNPDTPDGLANNPRAYVKDTDEVEASGIKRHMGGDSPPQVTSAQQNDVQTSVNSQDRADFLMQRLHIVAIALLAKSAETVKILTNLRSSDPHLLGELSGRNAVDAIFEKIT